MMSINLFNIYKKSLINLLVQLVDWFSQLSNQLTGFDQMEIAIKEVYQKKWRLYIRKYMSSKLLSIEENGLESFYIDISLTNKKK